MAYKATFEDNILGDTIHTSIKPSETAHLRVAYVTDEIVYLVIHDKSGATDYGLGRTTSGIALDLYAIDYLKTMLDAAKEAILKEGEA